MNHADFILGGTFWCGGRRFRCTDIGSRVIVAIPCDSLEVVTSAIPSKDPLAPAPPRTTRTLTWEEAEAEGWFNGPPYAVQELVFDEYDQEGCSLEPDAEDE